MISVRLLAGAHHVSAALTPSLRELEIADGEAHVLVTLLDGPKTPTSIHRAFGHRRSTLTNVLDRLESKGLVERRPNPADRRSVLIETTSRGNQHARRVRADLDRLDRRVAAAVTPADVGGFENVLNALEEVTA